MTDLTAVTTEELIKELRSRSELFILGIKPLARKDNEPDLWVTSSGSKGASVLEQAGLAAMVFRSVLGHVHEFLSTPPEGGNR